MCNFQCKLRLLESIHYCQGEKSTFIPTGGSYTIRCDWESYSTFGKLLAETNAGTAQAPDPGDTTDTGSGAAGRLAWRVIPQISTWDLHEPGIKKNEIIISGF
jgi:hypothetical protein